MVTSIYMVVSTSNITSHTGHHSKNTMVITSCDPQCHHLQVHTVIMLGDHHHGNCWTVSSSTLHNKITNHPITWSRHAITWSRYLITWSRHPVTWSRHPVTWSRHVWCIVEDFLSGILSFCKQLLLTISREKHSIV